MHNAPKDSPERSKEPRSSPHHAMKRSNDTLTYTTFSCCCRCSWQVCCLKPLLALQVPIQFYVINYTSRGPFARGKGGKLGKLGMGGACLIWGGKGAWTPPVGPSPLRGSTILISHGQGVGGNDLGLKRGPGPCLPFSPAPGINYVNLPWAGHWRDSPWVEEGAWTLPPLSRTPRSPEEGTVPVHTQVHSRGNKYPSTLASVLSLP